MLRLILLLSVLVSIACGFNCPTPGGLYPNPSDSTCATYYHCSRGTPYKKPCPPGLIFDPSSKTCNWSWAYKCPGGSGGGGGGGSGPAPTTARPAPTQQYPEPETTPWKPSKPSGNSCNKKIVCYYPNWAHYRKGKGNFKVGNIDVNLCTHLVYAFAVLNTQSFKMKVFDDWLDNNLNNYKNFVALKKKNPKLKTMIAIGGWTDSQNNAGSYKKMFRSKTLMHTFARDAVKFMDKWGFDGLDLDYEHPHAAEKAGFANWIKELRNVFGSKYELTAAISASPGVIREGLDVPVMAKYMDAIHIMAYDYHGSWEKKADHHAALYSRSWDRDLNCDSTVKTLMQLGAPASKLVLGIPTYGRSWTVQGSNMKPPVSASGAGTRGPITGEAGNLGYMEICMKVKNEGWKVVDDDNGPYAYGSGNQWVGYDTIKSVTKKAEYVKTKNLGGAMFWDLATDDFNNQCGDGRFPLITAVSNALNNC